MDRLCNRFFEGWPAPEFFRGEWELSFDVSETEENMLLRAEIPGMDPKGTEVSLSNGVLTIKGENKQEKDEQGENYHRMGTRCGAFRRSVRLPCEVENEKIEVESRNGVLNIARP